MCQQEDDILIDGVWILPYELNETSRSRWNEWPSDRSQTPDMFSMYHAVPFEEERMKSIVVKIACIIVFLSTPVFLSIAATQPPAVGGVLPKIVLPVPDLPEHQTYLGIKGKQDFTIPEIEAPIVIVEIFSMY